MKFTSTVIALLAFAPSALFAAPTPTAKTWTAEDIKQAMKNLPPSVLETLTNGVCDLSAATFPSDQTTLPPPTGLKLAHVAIGRGTQNYTCSEDSDQVKPSQVGAWAYLYNATCGYVRAPAVVADTTLYAYNASTPLSDEAAVLLSGHHEFIDTTTPFFNMNTANGNYGTVTSKKANATDAPASAPAGSVPWLKLNGISGDYKVVYRLNTAGGAAPANCTGRKGDFQVPYAAEYHFYK